MMKVMAVAPVKYTSSERGRKFEGNRMVQTVPGTLACDLAKEAWGGLFMSAHE